MITDFSGISISRRRKGIKGLLRGFKPDYSDPSSRLLKTCH